MPFLRYRFRSFLLQFSVAVPLVVVAPHYLATQQLPLKATAFASFSSTSFHGPRHMKRDHGDANHLLLFQTPPSSSSSSESKEDPSTTTSSSNSSMISTTADLDLARFHRRKEQLRTQRKTELPPHPSLHPKQVVTVLLDELRYADPYFDFDPLQPRLHKGVETLWQACTPRWQQVMATMVGIHNVTTKTSPTDESNNDQEQQFWMISALGRFLARPNQQFAILLGKEKDNNQNNNYWIDFPTDVVEWDEEDECWVECRLRDVKTNDLLVVLGWTLSCRNTDDNDNDNASCDDKPYWRLDGLDWQDFREKYRPGMGREEWERICG